MKTQEEIDEVYKKLYLSLDDSPHYHTWVRGYTQCQEDMADKKYTEEDLRIAFDTGYYTRDSFGDRSNNMTAEEYINSLNKQDNE
jgi:hypothetical protein